MMPVLGELAVATWSSLTATRRRVENRFVGLMNLSLVVLAIAGSFYAVVTWGEQAHRQPSTSIGSISYPAAEARFIQSSFPKARMLNHYDYGGYLIYALGPDIPVFIDGRADVYGRARVADFLTMAWLKPGWRAMLDRYQIDLVLFPTRSPLIQALTLDEGWKEAFRGKTESVFVRAFPADNP